MTYPVNHDILSGKSSPDAPRHPQPNKVSYLIRDAKNIPPKQDGKKQIYVIYENDVVIGVGETTHVPTRIRGGYVWCIRTMKPDGSTIIKEMQQRASAATAAGKVYHFEVDFVEQVDAQRARAVEADHIEYLRQQGYAILNKTMKKKHKA